MTSLALVLPSPHAVASLFRCCSRGLTFGRFSAACTSVGLKTPTTSVRHKIGSRGFYMRLEIEAHDTSIARDSSHVFGVVEDSSHNLGSGIAEEALDWNSGEIEGHYTSIAGDSSQVFGVVEDSSHNLGSGSAEEALDWKNGEVKAHDTSIAGDSSHVFGVVEDSSHNLGSGSAEEALDWKSGEIEAHDTSIAGDSSHVFGVVEDSSHNLGSGSAGEVLDWNNGEDICERSEEDGPYHMRRGGTALNKYGGTAEDENKGSEEVDIDRGGVEAFGSAEGKISEGKRTRRNRITKQLLQRGTSPIELLESMETCKVEMFWTVVNILCHNSRASEALLVFEWRKRQDGYVATEQDFTGFINICGRAGMPQEAQKLFNEMTSLALRPTVATYSCLLQSFAEVGDFNRAEGILTEMRGFGLKPNAITYTGLLYAYGKQGHYGEMAKIFNHMKTYESSQPDCAPTSVTYSALLQCFAKGGLFARMEKALKEMTSRYLAPDGAAVNAMIQGYAEAGLLKDMERAYSLVRPYKVKVRVDTIRAVALGYIRKSYFYQLGTFARYHNRRRVTLDNLIENLLLLSHAANFSMRGLAEEYVRLKETGFEADLTGFNIRALAFSKMQMLWDLRVTILEMVNQGVMPDLVTYGAVVDAYVSGNMESSLAEALAEMPNTGDIAKVHTDELVFDAFGRGPFQKCCEELSMSAQDVEKKFFTYENLVGYYLKTLEILSARKARKKLSNRF